VGEELKGSGGKWKGSRSRREVKGKSAEREVEGARE
jgi:hypothetical protein